MNDSTHDRTPDFRGKVVAFYSGSSPPFSTVILSPVFETQQGRLFVVGASAPRTPKRWDDDLQTAIAWEDIVTYNVFDSLQDYNARMSLPEYTQPRTKARWLARFWQR